MLQNSDIPESENLSDVLKTFTREPYMERREPTLKKKKITLFIKNWDLFKEKHVRSVALMELIKRTGCQLFSFSKIHSRKKIKTNTVKIALETGPAMSPSQVIHEINAFKCPLLLWKAG